MLVDDIAQEAFIKAYTNIRTFQGISRFKTWLYRIAYNEWITSMRRMREESLPDDVSTTMEQPSVTLASSDARMDVATCLRYLSDAERSVVLLFYLEDCPIKKVAQITGFPEGTVKSHLSRAKAKMADIMKR